VTFPGARLRVQGTVKPYVADQSVTVNFYRGGRLLGRRYANVKSIGDDRGQFVAGLNVGELYETITVKAVHWPTALQAGATARAVRVPVIAPSAPPGSSGPAVDWLQQALAGLHYAVPLSGVMDEGTQWAVLAFRKLADLDRTFVADGQVFQDLSRGQGAFTVRFPNQGDHFEGDLTHQVLAEVLPGGHVRAIYAISSGKPSTPTVIGTFYVYRKAWGTSSDGMVDSSYFIRGYAIHGYAQVPTYPASHGCMRLPIFDAPAVYDWSQLGDPVDVYYRGGGGSSTVAANAGP
jgi:hypothetical protein